MTERSKPRVAGLLLAAGSSSRLGRPKQLVEFEGKTLIRRAADALIEAGCSPVIVVLGAEIEASKEELKDLDLRIVENVAWESGMGSSIAVGVARLLDIEPSTDAILIALCDQPYVTGEKLRAFVEQFAATRRTVIAAEYHGIAGVPALFSSELFSSLALLQGDKGARGIIRNSPDAMTIPLPEAGIDVDTIDDLNRFGDQIRPLKNGPV